MLTQLRIFLCALLFCALVSLNLRAQSIGGGDVIVDIIVEGNAKVESDAIVTMLKSQKGEPLSSANVAEDIRILYQLGYFSDIRVFKEPFEGGTRLVVKVAEKPAIVSIEYEGMHEVKPDDLKDKIETKLYTIVNEGALQRDLGVIEKQYLDKGFYLARATYKLENKSSDEVALTFMVDEGQVVRVGEVHVNGNNFFTEGEIVNRLFLRPFSRRSEFSAPPSMFRDDMLQHSSAILDYMYRDQGFADVKLAKPITQLDQDREYVRATFEVEEGQQFYVNSIDFSGDLLFTKEELTELLQLKPEGLFRRSLFDKDITLLSEKYGDLGYAFVDVNPIVKFNRDASPATVDIRYDITKGDKVYFGTFTIVGNAKSRDNVIRREFSVADSELYSGSKLSESKREVERLGYFEEVQVIRSRDDEDPLMLNYVFRVKDKPTGQLQASVGFQPGQARAENQWFGQGTYREDNQSGYGYQTNLTGKWNGGQNYELSTGFSNPRVNDSLWSFGINAFFRNTARDLTDEIEVQERRVGAGISLGRKIIELIRGSISYQVSKIETSSDSFLMKKFREDGVKSSATLALSRNSTNNYLDPSSGSNVKLSQTLAGGFLGGDFQYMESTADSSLYLPIDFTETYRTYFHFKAHLGYIYSLSGEPVPLFERYRLGGNYDLRGYNIESIGPHYNIMQTPQGRSNRFNGGGDKKLYFQLEYFVPLIQEANIKALVFMDAGRVYNDDEDISLQGMKSDYGFGFRWLTPLAPFRFEWAYPMDKKDGDMKFIFSLGSLGY